MQNWGEAPPSSELSCTRRSRMREKCAPAPAPAWRGRVPAQMWEGRAQSRCRCGSETGLAPAKSAPQPAGVAPATAAPGLGPPLRAFAPGFGRVVCGARYDWIYDNISVPILLPGLCASPCVSGRVLVCVAVAHARVQACGRARARQRCVSSAAPDPCADAAVRCSHERSGPRVAEGLYFGTQGVHCCRSSPGADVAG